MRTFLEYLGVSIAFLTAGFMGSLLSLTKEKKEKPIKLSYALIRLTTGAMTANYLTPLIASLFLPQTNEAINSSAAIINGIAFFVGYAGVSILDLLMSYLEKVTDINVEEDLKEDLKEDLEKEVEKEAEKDTEKDTEKNEEK